MQFVHKIEKSLEGVFESLPPLPKEVKQVLAKIWPWLALIAGVLQLLAAWGLYNWARKFNDLSEWANRFSEALGGPAVANRGVTFWVGLGVVVLVIDAIILLLAFPRLQKKQKSGWDLLFLGGLLNLVYGIVSLFIDGRGGLGGLFWALLSSAIGFYLLFQVREYFGGKALKSTK